MITAFWQPAAKLRAILDWSVYTGSGCAPVKNWQAVYNLLVSLNAKITRVDLAHDDFAGIYNIATVLEMRELDQFTISGRPPKALFMDDFDSGDGKTDAEYGKYWTLFYNFSG